MKKYKAKNDYKDILKKDAVYTSEDLIKIVGSETKLNYMLKCTTMKNFVFEVSSDVEEVVAEVASDVEEVNVEPIKITYLIEKDIKKGGKIALKEGDKLSFSEIEEILGEKEFKKALEKKLIIETKLA